jgi:hypothetical protein
MLVCAQGLQILISLWSRILLHASRATVVCRRSEETPLGHEGMSRWGRKARPPQGFEYLEPTLAALEAELRESRCQLIFCLRSFSD